MVIMESEADFGAWILDGMGGRFKLNRLRPLIGLRTRRTGCRAKKSPGQAGAGDMKRRCQ